MMADEWQYYAPEKKKKKFKGLKKGFERKWGNVHKIE
jgi:hypothetical protein